MEPTLLHHLLDHPRTAAVRPALTAGRTTLTHEQLVAASHRMSHVLHDRGLRRGDRLVVTGTCDVHLPALLFAASRLGVIFSVIHEEVRGEILAHILNDSGPRLFVTGDTHVNGADAAHGVPTVRLGRLTHAATTAPESPVGAEQPLPVDPACLIYTSGTTAMPKAVVSTHGQSVFATRAIARRLRYTSDDVIYSPLPLSFDYGLYQVFLAAEAGAHLQLAPAEAAGPSLLKNLNAAGATVLPAVPPVAAGLLRLLQRQARERPALRLMTNTGAAMPAEVLTGLRQLLPSLRVQLMYGLTECKRVSILEPDEDLRKPETVGRPLDGTEVFTVDADGARLPAGCPGEITVRGPHVMAGYWRRPDLTAERFVRRDGLFPELRTGDYGFVDADGHLHFDGRRDDVYKQQGFRVSAIEVEAAARRIPGVDTAAVLVPTAERPEALLVISGTAEPHDVLQRLGERIETYKVPARCHRMALLPTNANGKIDKKRLAELAGESVHV
ncbi:class I adenylate-forming enzyme family protein [Streptomyces sp. NPDC052496]|uniref:class I adenylate-forming enzyme family protein n=1 Tax=Streptomyces sp. NPDC052496 TaxID=3154951 RepID=UPI003443EF61